MIALKTYFQAYLKQKPFLFTSSWKIFESTLSAAQVTGKLSPSQLTAVVKAYVK